MYLRDVPGRPVHPALLVATASAAYGAVFPLAHDTVGPAATTLVLIPVATIAWLAGTGAGVIGAVVSVPLNLVLLGLTGSHGLAPLLQAVLPALAGMAYIAGAMGWPRRRRRRAGLAPPRGAKLAAALAEIGRGVNSSTDMTEIYHLFAVAVRRLIPWDRIALTTVDEETDELTLVYSEGVAVAGWDVGMRRPVHDTFMEDLRATGRGVHLAGEQLDRAGVSRATLREYAAAGLHTLLAVPLVCDRRIIGAMSLGLTRRGGYPESSHQIAGSVAGQIAGAIARSRLNARAVQLAHERAVRVQVESENRELERVREAKNEFLSTVSHELRTPLATILGFADVLARNRTGNLSTRQLEQLGLIQRNGRRLGVLINDLVDVSGIEAGRFDIEPFEFEAVGLLQEVATLFGPAALARRQTLGLRFPDAPVRMLADRARLAQVMDHLLDNASIYSPEGSHIDFAAHVERNRLAIMVRDRGVGISAADQSRIFTLFFRARNEATRSVPGAGLGLVICQRIIALHGGSITIESEEGAGTTMRFQIPGVLQDRRAGTDACAPEPHALGAVLVH